MAVVGTSNTPDTVRLIAVENFMTGISIKVTSGKVFFENCN